MGMLQVEDSRLQVRTLTARAGTNQGDANPPRSQTWQREEPGSAAWDLARRHKRSSKADLLLQSRKRGYFGLIFHFRSFIGKL